MKISARCLLLAIAALAVMSAAAGPVLSMGTGADWHLDVETSTPTYSLARIGIIGSMSGASDGADGNDVPFGGLPPSFPAAFFYEPGMAPNWKLMGDFKSALTGGNAKTWKVVAYVGSGYPNSPMRISFFSDSGYEPPTLIGGSPYEYVVTVQNDPTGAYAAGTSWTYPAGASGSPIAPPLTKVFINVTPIRTDDPSEAVNGKGIGLIVEAKPAGYVQISGQVKESGGNPGSGTTMTATGLPPVTADIWGRYWILVPSGWSGTVTPSYPTCVFTPPNRTYTNLTASVWDQDYTYQSVPLTYVISGTITRPDGSPFQGVSVLVDSGNPVTTDAAGFYQATVSVGWSGAVTPNAPGYYFTPASRSYSPIAADQTDQNYSSSQNPMISGTIKVGLVGLYNVKIHLTGLGMAQGKMPATNGDDDVAATTDRLGNYSFRVPYGWQGTVVPELSGYRFDPASYTYIEPVLSDTICPDFGGTLIDTTPPTVSISPPSVPATKNGPVSFTVTYSDNVGVTGITLTDLDLEFTRTGTANFYADSVAVVDSNTSLVTLSSIEGNGTISISIKAGTAHDAAGNLAPATGPSATFTVDNTPPVIAATTFGWWPVEAGDSMSLHIEITDNVGVTGASLGPNPMTHTSGDTWTGSLTAAAGLGPHTVDVTASDAAGNTYTRAIGYTVSRSFGTNISALYHHIMSNVWNKYLYTVWGKATGVSHNVQGEVVMFVLSDGSGNILVYVLDPATAPDITNDDYVSVRGAWEATDTMLGQVIRKY